MRIHVHGTGIEALCAALVLRHNGFSDVHVIDAPTAPDDPVVELPASATRILYTLGLRDALEAAAAAPHMEHQRSARTGYLLAQRPLGPFATDRYKAPCLVIERQRFHELLTEALHTPRLSPGQSADADVTVIANGADSILRDNIAPLTTIPTAWSSTWLPSTSSGNTITAWLAADAWCRQVPTPEGTWLLSVHGKATHPRLAQLTTAGTDAVWCPVIDAEPLPSWFAGNTVLLGSAAHPLLPFCGFATMLALEDAWVLARMLDGMGDDLALCFAEYQRYRLPRANRMQNHARTLGLLFTEQSPLAIIKRNLRLALAYWFLPEIAMQSDDWLFEYDCIKGFD